MTASSASGLAGGLPVTEEAERRRQTVWGHFGKGRHSGGRDRRKVKKLHGTQREASVKEFELCFKAINHVQKKKQFYDILNCSLHCCCRSEIRLTLIELVWVTYISGSII